MMSVRSPWTAFLILPLLSCLLSAQQANSSAGSLDLNGASSSGSAPFAAVIEQPNPLQISVTGTTNQPFVLLSGAMIAVGNTFYPAGQLDIGPMPTVILDGLQGPYSPYFANTGPSGGQVFQIDVPTGSVTLGTVLGGLQAAVIDPMSPFNVSLTAASSFSFTANVGGNAVPIANAGVSTFVNGSTCVTLDASASSDPEAQSLTYAWTQIAGTTVTLSSATDMMPSFLAPAGTESLVFELVVNDGVQDSLPATVYVAVQATMATVSFATDVYPIFGNQSCTGCHGSSGGLALSGSVAATYTELMDPANASGLRTDPCDPASSLILSKPLSTGAGGVSHSGGSAFASTADPDYITILNWIAEGAQNN